MNWLKWLIGQLTVLTKIFKPEELLSKKDVIEFEKFMGEGKASSGNPSGCNCNYRKRNVWRGGNRPCDCDIHVCFCKLRHQMSFAEYVGRAHFKQFELEIDRLVDKGMPFVTAAQFAMRKYRWMVEQPGGRAYRMREKILEDVAMGYRNE